MGGVMFMRNRTVRQGLRKRLKTRVRLVHQHGQLAQCFFYDLMRFTTHSSSGKRVLNAGQLEALMNIDSHRIEKGLSLPATRPGFGRDVVERLAANTESHRGRGFEPDASERSASALRAYLDFHDSSGLQEAWMNCVRPIAAAQRSDVDADQECGTMTVRRSDVLAAIPDGMEGFFHARHSVRQFAPGTVSDADIERAVRIATRTPSVCNRQSWRVHDYASRADIDSVLAFQNGNRGFGNDIARLLIVTSDLHTFAKPGERYQCWIDGGMFAMSLVYGLLSQGLGTCTLNCSNDWRRDVALRRSAGIPKNEAVIMMIGVGQLREEYQAARSPRRSAQEVLRQHGGRAQGHQDA
jgi:nitroreductase